MPQPQIFRLDGLTSSLEKINKQRRYKKASVFGTMMARDGIKTGGLRAYFSKMLPQIPNRIVEGCILNTVYMVPVHTSINLGPCCHHNLSILTPTRNTSTLPNDTSNCFFFPTQRSLLAQAAPALPPPPSASRSAAPPSTSTCSPSGFSHKGGEALGGVGKIQVL